MDYFYSSDSDCSSEDESEIPLEPYLEELIVDDESQKENIDLLKFQSGISVETVLEYFQLFITQEIVDYIVRNSNMKMENQDGSKRLFQSDEFYVFIGIIIGRAFTNCTTDELWSSNPLVCNNYIQNMMSRDRYKLFLKYLTLSQEVSVENDEKDKLTKIRFLINSLRECCMSVCEVRDNVSIDEAMQAFKGRCSFIQYNPMKPIKRGFKIWSLADSRTGYIHNFSIYVGKEENVMSKHGLGERVVLDIIGKMKNLNIFGDSFFSSMELCTTLMKNDNRYSGTIRSNRKNFPFSNKSLKERGSWKKEQIGNVNCFAWVDKKEIFFVSTLENSGDSAQVQRKNKEGKTVNIRCPHVVVDYNKNMGGVDHSDQLRSYHNAKRRSIKWYMPLFYYAIDIAVTNAHVLYANHHRQYMSSREFRYQLVKELFANGGSQRKKFRLASSSSILESSSMVNHYIIHSTLRRLCNICKKRCTLRCAKCDVWLCMVCFPKYHNYL